MNTYVTVICNTIINTDLYVLGVYNSRNKAEEAGRQKINEQFELENDINPYYYFVSKCKLK